MQGLREQTAGFERALGRFFQACAADQAACLGFGGTDPWDDVRLADRPGQRHADAGRRLHARPAAGHRRRLIAAATVRVYAKQFCGRCSRRRCALAAGGRRHL